MAERTSRRSVSKNAKNNKRRMRCGNNKKMTVSCDDDNNDKEQEESNDAANQNDDNDDEEDSDDSGGNPRIRSPGGTLHKVSLEEYRHYQREKNRNNRQQPLSLCDDDSNSD
jgi:hypothetical protein